MKVSLCFLDESVRNKYFYLETSLQSESKYLADQLGNAFNEIEIDCFTGIQI